jgi:hypothetical protein
MTGRLAVLCLALVALAGNAGAQRSAPPPWGIGYPPEFVDATPAERASVMATLDEIERILRQVPELAQPHGFEIVKNFGSKPLASEPTGLFHMGIGLQFFAPSRAIEHEGRSCIQVDVNFRNGRPSELRSLVGEDGREFLLEFPVGEPKPGSTVVYEGLRWDTPELDRRPGFVTFTRGGVFPWVPVTREQYLRAQILGVEGRSGDKETSFRKELEKTSYDRWMDEAAARKQQREASIASMARAQGAAAADELRRTLEQTEREVTENLKAQDAEERARAKAFLATSTLGDQYRRELAALSESERRSPAMLSGGVLAAADAQGAHRVLLPDPEFWRARRSRTEVHSITLSFYPNQTCMVPAVREAVEKAYATLDWMAFKRMVERPW